MASTHKWDHVIREWMRGKVAQYLDDGIWRDIAAYDGSLEKMPHFYQDTRGEYRVKPVLLRYRHAVVETRGASSLQLVTTLEEERVVQNAPGFSRWLDDWTEVTL